uniref:Protein SPT2 homolog n=1 Tax=Anopheles dirus TaxID=7168 RepID=A0A182NAE1_9DIPT
MDFGTLLRVAEQNTLEAAAQKSKGRYREKISPPKVVKKKPGSGGEKVLSENIRKFLAKRDEEERQKQQERQQKAQELMSKRDTKAKRKIEKMLKVIKSANKSVLDDATDAQETALATDNTIEQDDYGYSSNVASQFYEQLMDKYKCAPEEPKFKEPEKRTMSKEDMARAKARVKDALIRQKEEENAPRSRKRTAGTSSATAARVGPDPYDPVEEKRRREEKAPVPAAATSSGKDDKKPPGAKGGPPVRRQNAVRPEGFAELLKLAEKKQHEPIVVRKERSRNEPERLMTKREKKEYEERQVFEKMKRLRDRIEEDPTLSEEEKIRKVARLNALRAAGKLPGIAPLPATSNGPSQVTGSVPKKPVATSLPTPAAPVSALPRIPKRTDDAAASSSASSGKQVVPKTPSSSSVPRTKPLAPPPTAQPKHHDSKLPSASSKSSAAAARNGLPDTHKNGIDAAAGSTRDKSKTAASTSVPKTKPASAGVKQQLTRPSPAPTATATSGNSSASGSVKTRQFPPPDMMKRRPAAVAPPARAPAAKKGRRVIDSDSEEYDSEMDDFIDDEDTGEDYSSAIKAIFGYDKSRYRNDQYDDHDDYNMESSYAQQMREEYISKKIGIMEDLEDMRMEEEEKRRKMDKKKKVGGASKPAPSKRK